MWMQGWLKLTSWQTEIPWIIYRSDQLFDLNACVLSSLNWRTKYPIKLYFSRVIYTTEITWECQSDLYWTSWRVCTYNRGGDLFIWPIGDHAYMFYGIIVHSRCCIQPVSVLKKVWISEPKCKELFPIASYTEWTYSSTFNTGDRTLAVE